MKIEGIPQPSRALTQRSGIVVAALALMALALRLYRLGTQSLWLDEGSTWAEVTGRTGKGWLTLTAELFSPNAGYPLYHLLLRGWVSLAGDSEWALRFPSALAGAVACGIIALAAAELGTTPPRIDLPAVAAGFAALIAPYALWHAQDAKAYSLLLLAMSIFLWLTLRAIRRGDGRSWLAALIAALLCVFVHRLALLGIAGIALGVCIAPPVALGRWRNLFVRRWPALIAALLCGGVGIAGTLAAARTDSAGVSAAAGPLSGIGLTLTRFALDRWPGDIDGFLGLPFALWITPFAIAAIAGVVLLVRDARPGAVPVLCGLLVPLVLLAIVRTLAPIYEPRYAMVAFAPWLLILAYPLRHATTALRQRSAALLALLIALASAGALFQPHKGLFSGAPVKEEWRAAVDELARRAMPDDLVIIHPYYVMPLYDYYAGRVTPDPLPTPVSFPIFAEGDRGGLDDEAALREFVRKRYEPFYQEQAQGRRRALLLIAPDHARTVDPPPTPADTYGWVGLRFEYPQRTWPCGGAEFVGVALMCQSYPELFGTGIIPEPTILLAATFGGEVRLRGYTIAPHGGTLRAGGTLPVTLFWEAAAAPTHDYRMFLHLCQDCDVPPLANNDGPPLFGYGEAGRTTTWQIGDPVHDERALALPADLAPGRYTLLLGVYSVDGSAERLPVATTAPTIGSDRLVVGEVEVSVP